MRNPGWQLPSMSGRTVIVTGSSSGIGFEAARALAGKGAFVVLACRNLAKGKAAADRIGQEFAGAATLVSELDLSSLGSVRSFADTFRARHERLDVLINNAGVMALPFTRSVDGFEMQFATNHLGHFALASRLFALLTRTTGSRVVTVSSHMHRFGKLRMRHDEATYSPWGAYNESKLANLLFTLELDRRLKRKGGLPVLAVACHPGYSATELQEKSESLGGTTWRASVTRFGNSLFAQTAERGALPTLRAATDPDVVGGEYFGPTGPFEMWGDAGNAFITARARDAESAAALWTKSVEWTGEDFGGL